MILQIVRYGSVESGCSLGLLPRLDQLTYPLDLLLCHRRRALLMISDMVGTETLTATYEPVSNSASDEQEHVEEPVSPSGTTPGPPYDGWSGRIVGVGRISL